ncbi:MAG: amino acid permease [Acidobacteria bacterium]|nr:amino acid permease [Acidobacteriota bacterium]
MPGSATPPALNRSIGLLHATAMVVGIIVGASIFVQPTEISRHVPSVAGLFLVWVLAGLLTFCGALVCSELAAAFPATGGVYVFLRQTVSPALGFLWGWAMFWSVHSGIIAATSVILARYIAWFAGFGDLGIRITAIAGVLCLSAVNYVGVRPGSVVQTAITAAKILGILLMLLAVAVIPHSGPAADGGLKAAAATPAAAPVGFREFVLAISAALFAFGGWHMVTYAAGETRAPGKTIPRALLIGTLTVAACYLAMNAACLSVLPLDRVMASKHVAADAAGALVGPRGGAAVSALVIISSLGVLNGVILAGPRVYLAMACDGLGLRWMSAVHPRFHTPHHAILAQAVWASILVATGTYRALFTRVIYTEWLFFALMTVGLLRLRFRPSVPSTASRRASLYPLVPVVFIISSLTVVANQIVADPLESAKGLLLVAAGLPVYYLLARRATEPSAAADEGADRPASKGTADANH